MSITRTDINEVYEDGRLVTSEVVEVDITAEVVTLDLHARLRQLAADFAAAQATLDAIVSAPQVTFSNISGAQTQVRALQAQVKDEARILRGLAKRFVGFATIYVGDHDAYDGTD